VCFCGDKTRRGKNKKKKRKEKTMGQQQTAEEKKMLRKIANIKKNCLSNSFFPLNACHPPILFLLKKVHPKKRLPKLLTTS
jgi:hypothetical protein